MLPAEPRTSWPTHVCGQSQAQAVFFDQLKPQVGRPVQRNAHEAGSRAPASTIVSSSKLVPSRISSSAWGYKRLNARQQASGGVV